MAGEADDPVYSPDYVERWPTATKAFLLELAACHELAGAIAAYAEKKTKKNKQALEAAEAKLAHARGRYIRAADFDERRQKEQRVARVAEAIRKQQREANEESNADG